ncbi:hypothetical protein Pelo_12369 [Pelomyxa schiedti]|nr:hypothetical protein Pelo_12369 [Pelomyxa schiedti]
MWETPRCMKRTLNAHYNLSSKMVAELFFQATDRGDRHLQDWLLDSYPVEISPRCFESSAAQGYLEQLKAFISRGKISSKCIEQGIAGAAMCSSPEPLRLLLSMPMSHIPTEVGLPASLLLKVVSRQSVELLLSEMITRNTAFEIWRQVVSECQKLISTAGSSILPKAAALSSEALLQLLPDQCPPDPTRFSGELQQTATLFAVQSPIVSRSFFVAHPEKIPDFLTILCRSVSDDARILPFNQLKEKDWISQDITPVLRQLFSLYEMKELHMILENPKAIWTRGNELIHIVMSLTTTKTPLQHIVEHFFVPSVRGMTEDDFKAILDATGFRTTNSALEVLDILCLKVPDFFIYMQHAGRRKLLRMSLSSSVLFQWIESHTDFETLPSSEVLKYLYLAEHHDPPSGVQSFLKKHPSLNTTRELVLPFPFMVQFFHVSTILYLIEEAHCTFTSLNDLIEFDIKRYTLLKVYVSPLALLQHRFPRSEEAAKVTRITQQKWSAEFTIRSAGYLYQSFDHFEQQVGMPVRVPPVFDPAILVPKFW